MARALVINSDLLITTGKGIVRSILDRSASARTAKRFGGSGTVHAMSATAESALLSVFHHSYGELVGFVKAKVGCAAAAADIVQETYLRIASAPEEGIANPRAFMYRIAGNLAIDHLRREQSRAKYIVGDAVPENLHPATPSAEQHLLDHERLLRLAKAIAELPPRCREVFMLRRFGQLHQAQIAERLGISRNMVEKHMRHALLHCLQQVDGEE